SRVTSALATALHAGPWKAADLAALRDEFFLPTTPKLETPLVLLVAVEVTGARRFLERPGGTADGVRGRALFADRLGDAAARRMTARLGLALTSVLDRSGPRFVLAAPVGCAWEAAAREADAALAPRARGELGVEAAAVELTLADFRAGLGGPWLELEDR